MVNWPNSDKNYLLSHEISMHGLRWLIPCTECYSVLSGGGAKHQAIFFWGQLTANVCCVFISSFNSDGCK